MSKFYAQSDNGKFKLLSSRANFKQDLKDNHNARYLIERITPESKEMRGFFEGAVVVLFCFFQEYLDHHSSSDQKYAREWLKREFNADYKTINGKSEKFGKSTKGVLNKFLNKVIDFMEEQYGIDREEVLSPPKYKVWRDTIFPTGGSDNFIDYLVEIKKL